MRKFSTKIIAKVYGLYLNVLALFSKKLAAEKAFQIFSKVRKGQVLPEQYAYLEAAKNEVLNACGHRVQTYRWNGAKETVLLVHGWESNSFRWRNLINILREPDYNIIAFDAPGHGHTSGKRLHIPLYAECIQHMIQTYRPRYIIGHSVGGMTVLFNEYTHNNDGVEKIVTIGSPSEAHEIFTHYHKLLGFNSRVKKALEDYFRMRFGFQVHELSSSSFVSTNMKKGLLLHDELDKLAPFHASEKVHASWKGSTFIRTKGLGHSMHQSHINEQILEFLQS